MTTLYLSVDNLLEKLSTINETNLDEIELHLYALKGFASDNEELVEFCNMLVENIDNAFSNLYIEEIEDMEASICKFREIVEVMQNLEY